MCPQSAQGTSALPLLRAQLQETTETFCRTMSGAHRRVGVDRHAPRQHFDLLGRELVLLFLMSQTAIAAIACPNEIQKASATSITPATHAVFNTSTATTACRDESITQHACSDGLMLASYSIHLQATMQNCQQGRARLKFSGMGPEQTHPMCRRRLHHRERGCGCGRRQPGGWSCQPGL